jgi:hypothetical protein
MSGLGSALHLAVAFTSIRDVVTAPLAVLRERGNLRWGTTTKPNQCNTTIVKIDRLQRGIFLPQFVLKNQHPILKGSLSLEIFDFMFFP